MKKKKTHNSTSVSSYCKVPAHCASRKRSKTVFSSTRCPPNLLFWCFFLFPFSANSPHTTPSQSRTPHLLSLSSATSLPFSPARPARYLHPLSPTHSMSHDHGSSASDMMSTASSAAMDMDMGDPFCTGDGSVMLNGFQVSPLLRLRLLSCPMPAAASTRSRC